MRFAQEPNRRTLSFDWGLEHLGGDAALMLFRRHPFHTTTSLKPCAQCASLELEFWSSRFEREEYKAKTGQRVRRMGGFLPNLVDTPCRANTQPTH